MRSATRAGNARRVPGGVAPRLSPASRISTTLHAGTFRCAFPSGSVHGS
jgi:hypothetical protein